jgi:hypothetical protein
MGGRVLGVGGLCVGVGGCGCGRRHMSVAMLVLLVWWWVLECVQEQPSSVYMGECAPLHLMLD